MIAARINVMGREIAMGENCSMQWRLETLQSSFRNSLPVFNSGSVAPHSSGMTADAVGVDWTLLSSRLEVIMKGQATVLIWSKASGVQNAIPMK
jgi:hypothetical protein